MRIFIVLGFVVVGLSVLAGVLAYTLVPGLIESRLVTNLQERYGFEKEHEIQLSSDFPPELLVGASTASRCSWTS